MKTAADLKVAISLLIANMCELQDQIVRNRTQILRIKEEIADLQRQLERLK